MRFHNPCIHYYRGAWNRRIFPRLNGVLQFSFINFKILPLVPVFAVRNFYSRTARRCDFLGTFSISLHGKAKNNPSLWEMERREFECQLYSGSSLLQEGFLSGGVCGLGRGVVWLGCERKACRQVLR